MKKAINFTIRILLVVFIIIGMCGVLEKLDFVSFGFGIIVGVAVTAYFGYKAKK